MPQTTGFTLSPLVEAVRKALPDRELYLVGGAVRDALLGQVSHDLDFCVPESAIGLARKVAHTLAADFYVLDEDYDAARVIVRGEAGGVASRDFLDFTSFRLERNAPQRRAEARAKTTLEDDLRRRDFTINAIAYDLGAGALLDPLHGAADLRLKIIRACSPAAMQDDPIRILRGVRMATTFDCRIEPATRQAMKEAVQGLPKISPERMRDELFKTLDGRRPDASMRALELLGVFPYMLPELQALKGVQQSAPHVADVWDHTLRVMQHLEGMLAALAPTVDAGEKNADLFTGLLSLRLGRYREQLTAHFVASLNPERSIRALLFFAALYHDVSKPATRTVDETGRIRFLGHEGSGAEVAAERARALNLSNDEVGRLQTIIANHMRFHFHSNRLQGEARPPTRKAIYRFFRDTGEAGVDLVLLGLADLRGTRGPTLDQEGWTSALDVARILLENYWERPQEAVSPPRLMDGNEVMAELGLAPGPLLGELLAAIREAQAEGQVADREQALRFARGWLKQRD